MTGFETRHSYLDHLPRVFRRGDAGAWLGKFLQAFEEVLAGSGNPEDPGLEERLDGIPGPEPGTWRLRPIDHYFDPLNASDPVEHAGTSGEFLEWLSGWVAIELPAGWDEGRRRRTIARASSLYQRRGTEDGLRAMLQIWTECEAIEIRELFHEMRVGDPAVPEPRYGSTLGVDTAIGGLPHYITVTIKLADRGRGPGRREEVGRVARAVIEREIPAQVGYNLRLIAQPGMQIGVRSRVGADTELGE